MSWRSWWCALVLAMIFSSQLNELRFRRHRSLHDWRAWTEWRDTYIPPANGRNVA